MSPHLGKMKVKTVREGEGMLPMQVALPGVTGEDLLREAFARCCARKRYTVADVLVALREVAA